MRYFFLFLIIFPLIEIYTLIVIGGSIGAFTTMLWIFFSGIMGLYLLRNQGLKKLLDIQSKKSVFEPTADNFLKTIFTPIGGFFSCNSRLHNRCYRYFSSFTYNSYIHFRASLQLSQADWARKWYK